MPQSQPTVDIDKLRELLVALVRAPSVNPPGDEGPVAALMVERLEQLGLDTRTVESRAGRPSVIARLRGTNDGPILLLNGHMDVQPPGIGWTRDPFAASVEGTLLYGQGAMDMKAGLAAIVTAVDLLHAQRVRLRGDLLVAAVADEVCGGHLGTGWLVSQGLLQADMAVVCEPTGPAVRVAHRGALWLEVEVTGQSAHGGRPWLGVNAIGKLNRILVAIEDELAPSLQHRTHPLLPSPTFNVGTISGGSKFNLVADRAVAQIDRRMLPKETANQALGEVRALCERLCDADEQDWAVTVSEVMQVSAGEIEADAPIVEACRAAHRRVTGVDAEIAATAGFEDAHFLLDAGIPTAMFGPYKPMRRDQDPFFTTSGMADECVDLEDVARAAQVYAQLIKDLVG